MIPTYQETSVTAVLDLIWFTRAGIDMELANMLPDNPKYQIKKQQSENLRKAYDLLLTHNNKGE